VARADRQAMETRHLRIAEASAEVDAAAVLLRADAAKFARLGRAAEPIPPEARVRWPRDLALAAQLCLRATDRLATAASAHTVVVPSPLQRASRDLHAIVSHVGLNRDHCAVDYGRGRVGLDPASSIASPTSFH
jgi:hypothetical protein